MLDTEENISERPHFPNDILLKLLNIWFGNRLLLISEFFGFQWQKLAEFLSLFKLYNNLGKVAVRVKL